MKLYAPYSILFAATFIVITANLAIERLGLMSDANSASFELNNRTLWIQTVRDFFTEIKDLDPQICKEISRQFITIHEYLFSKGYKISSIQETKQFFESFFSSRIPFFEEFNRRFMTMACYSSDKQSYSFPNFRYLIFAMINVAESYPDFMQDLSACYQVEVLKFSSGKIDPDLYNAALKAPMK